MNILRESKVCMFFANIFRVFFVALWESVPLRIIRRLASSFSGSVVYKAILVVMRAIAVGFKGCFIYNLLKKYQGG